MIVIKHLYNDTSTIGLSTPGPGPVFEIFENTIKINKFTNGDYNILELSHAELNKLDPLIQIRNESSIQSHHSIN